MKLLRYLLPLVVAIGMASSSAYADIGDRTTYDEELNERDFDALRQFINSKRTLDLQEKSCNLTISGDVRTEWRNLYERCDGKSIIGNRNVKDDRCLVLGHNDFDIEFNLRLDYISDCAWGVAHVLYDNSAGVDGGIFAPRKVKKNPDDPNDCRIECVCTPEPIANCTRDSYDYQNKIMYIDGKVVPGAFTGCRTRYDNDLIGWHGSGTRNDINLRKAYMGINLYDQCGYRFDVELGRRNLYNVFDSKIQFLSRFDGILLKYTGYCENYMDWYIYWAGFVVDERVNHYAWVTEVGAENICDCCFDVKYSYIDWTKHGKNRCGFKNPIGFRFRNSQLSAAYRFTPEWINTQVKLYGAFLLNHCAPAVEIAQVIVTKAGKLYMNDKGELDTDQPNSGQFQFGDRTVICDDRFGWYIGFTFGQVCEQGDWAFDAQYQWVEFLSIPNNDVSGIGRGNFLGQSNTVNGRGNTNYKGYRFEFLYAITDNLTLDTIYEHSNALNKRIGGSHSFTKFELEAIYAF